MRQNTRFVIVPSEGMTVLESSVIREASSDTFDAFVTVRHAQGALDGGNRAQWVTDYGVTLAEWWVGSDGVLCGYWVHGLVP